MKKFIKVNFIILIVLCLSCSYVLINSAYAEEESVEDASNTENLGFSENGETENNFQAEENQN